MVAQLSLLVKLVPPSAVLAEPSRGQGWGLHQDLFLTPTPSSKTHQEGQHRAANATPPWRLQQLPVALVLSEGQEGPVASLHLLLVLQVAAATEALAAGGTGEGLLPAVDVALPAEGVADTEPPAAGARGCILPT